MSAERPINPRFEDDAWFRQVAPGPPRYQTRTDKPVRYFEVADRESGVVLGYIWASDEDDAAAWEPREAAGPRALMEGSIWFHRLEKAKGRGILPSEAVRELLAEPAVGKFGRVLPDSLREAPNAAAVKALAKGE
jgi:hypothetical protein